MLEPAKTVIDICGGVDAVSEITGRSTISVRRWGYSKEKGGSDGLIPAESQQKLIAAARKRKIALLPEHFFLPDEKVSA